MVAWGCERGAHARRTAKPSTRWNEIGLVPPQLSPPNVVTPSPQLGVPLGGYSKGAITTHAPPTHAETRPFQMRLECLRAIVTAGAPHA